jgi:hypothetical protein
MFTIFDWFGGGEMGGVIEVTKSFPCTVIIGSTCGLLSVV